MFCTVDSLVRQKFNTTDMAQRFVRWHDAEIWTPWGSVFDIGIATRSALNRVAGIHGGLGTVPEGWRTLVARTGDLQALFDRFAAACVCDD